MMLKVIFSFILFGITSITVFAQDGPDFTSQDYVWMGDKACEDGEWVDGISMYKKAVFLDSTNVSAFVQLSRAEHHIGQLESALTYSLKALSLDSNNVKAHEYAAVLYGISSNYEESEFHLLRIMEIDESSPISYYGLARIKTVTGDFDAALIYAKKALSIFEAEQAVETGDAQYLVGLLHFYKGNYDESKVFFSTARKNGVKWDLEIEKFMHEGKKILVTPESYYATEKELLDGLSYLVSNKAESGNDVKRSEICRFVLEWIGGAPHVHVQVNEKIVPYMTYGEAFVIYLAANAKYQLDHPDETEKWKAALVATQVVLQYYADNRDHFGKSKDLIKLGRLQGKNRLAEYIRSNY